MNISVHHAPPSAGVNELSHVFADHTVTLGHAPSNSVPDILHAIRLHLKMEVAFVSEFVNDQRIFRYVDSSWTKSPVQVGEGGPLDESYCQRVVDGRLPELINDAQANAVAAELPATFEIPVGAHMSVPIHLSDGSIYGTFCCFSRGVDTSLNMRDLSLMRVFADLAGKMIDRERHSIVNHRASMERVRRVLNNDAIHIVYQPIFDLNRGAIAGFESLARFSAMPARSPHLWFNEAHSIGLGIELELKAIQLALLVMPHLCEGLDLSINASPETILDATFEELLATLPSVEHLVLEITEHAAVEKYEEIAQRLKPYRDRGLQLAVDDAGAGYASFRHILNLEPDRIKLDMSLTRDIDADPARRALAAALIHFSADTGSKLVAEGVETAAEAAALIELGVDKAQGYFLGRPMALAGLQHLGCLRPGMAVSNSADYRAAGKSS